MKKIAISIGVILSLVTVFAFSPRSTKANTSKAYNSAVLTDEMNVADTIRCCDNCSGAYCGFLVADGGFRIYYY